MKPIEEHLADFLLGMQRGPGLKSYAKSCFRLWREVYGDRVANKAKAIVQAKIKE